MANKKYQVFVSSTFRDLVEERQDTIRNILDLNHIPAGMELFPAADVAQLSYIKKIIDECDYYLLIVGGRYGSLDDEGISFTEREYDYAVEKGKFVVAFVHSDPDAISVKNSDTKPELAAALVAFREKVMNGRLVKTWSNRQNLETAVIKSLTVAFNTYPQVGWIRGDATASDKILEQANTALQENIELRNKVERLSASRKLKYEKLAGLDDPFTVRYRTRHSSSSRSAPYYYTARTATLTWREIFIPLGAELTVAKTDLSISLAVKQALALSKAADNAYDVNDMDIATIKAQFIALGLISGKVGTSLKGTMHEYLSLTEQGKEAWMGEVVIRKVTPSIETDSQ